MGGGVVLVGGGRIRVVGCDCGLGWGGRGW